MSLANWLKTAQENISGFERKSFLQEMQGLTSMGMSEEKAAQKVAKGKIAELQKERAEIEKVIKDANNS